MTAELDAIAWNRKMAAETSAIISEVEHEPDTLSRAVELQILRETLRRYAVTADQLEETQRPELPRETIP